nr:DUF359 domain-containing protein [Candidatus Prometheoarchaeum syntrophicum]
MRKEFSKPLGKLFKGDPGKSFPKAIKWMKDQFSDLLKVSSLEKPLLVIGVGDIVSKSIVQDHFLSPLVKYLFIDGETQRGKNRFLFPEIESLINKTFKNPAGFINEEIFEFISETIDDNNHYLVVIDGEEDLLVIPAILKSKNTFIFYGQPPITDINPPIPAGCVVIYNNYEVKQRVEKLFEQMGRVSDIN